MGLIRNWMEMGRRDKQVQNAEKFLEAQSADSVVFLLKVTTWQILKKKSLLLPNWWDFIVKITFGIERNSIKAFQMVAECQ
jgi:hypothetical protein